VGTIDLVRLGLEQAGYPMPRVIVVLGETVFEIGMG
jgi:hypothetical protein